MNKEEFMSLYIKVRDGKITNLNKYDFKTLYRINIMLSEEISILKEKTMIDN